VQVVERTWAWLVVSAAIVSVSLAACAGAGRNSTRGIVCDHAYVTN
jgi:hypothetical protein